jgi:hypothetical protein
MKTVLFALSSMFLAQVANAGSCSSSTLGSTRFVNCSGGTSYTETDLGGTTFRNGRTGSGERISITDSDIGGTTFSSGSVGSRRYNATSSDIGDTTFTSGSLGGTRFNSTSTDLGTTTYTTGSYGGSSFGTTTYRSFRP